MSADITPAASGASSRRVGWTLLVGIAGLLYAYAVWNAVAHLVSFAGSGIAIGDWIVLLFAVVLPALVYAASIALTRRRGVLQTVLVLLAGLGVVAAFWMNVIAYSVASIVPRLPA